MKLNLLTYNIRGSVWTSEYSKRLAQLVAKHEVDILCLQEVVQEFNAGGNNDGGKGLKQSHPKRDILNELMLSLKTEGQRFEYFKFMPVQSSMMSVGNAILYRKGMLRPIGSPFTKHFPLLSQRTPLEEWANKFALPMRRVVMSEKFSLDHQKIVVYNAHLDYFGGDTRRIFQLMHFFKLWGRERLGDNVVEVIAGDFNTWGYYKFRFFYEFFSILRSFLRGKGFREATGHIPWTQVFDRKEADQVTRDGVVRVTAFEKIASTFHRTFKQKLDHIWVRGDAEIVSCERVDVEISDHYPVLLKLRLGNNEHA